MAKVYQRLLDGVERAGNLLPHPFWLFLILIGAVAIVSELAVQLDWQLALPDGSGTAEARSLLRPAALAWFVLHMVENFGHFEPLGLVLVMLMGVSIAEGSGLITTIMRRIALTVPARAVTPVLFALAACGNIGSDAGVVVVPPLAAAVFRQLGRNPIVGLMVGYVGATAGFTANLIPAGTDVLAVALTNAATNGNPEINVLANWYFMVVSVLFLAALGTWVTKTVVEPRVHRTAAPGPDGSRQDSPAGGDSDSPAAPSKEPRTPDPRRESRALAWALGAVALGAAVWLSMVLVPNGALRSTDPEQFWRSPFFKGLVPILFSLFALGGVVFGRVSGTVQRPDDVLDFMTEAMRSMGGYIVLVLAISQFTECFQYTGLDQLIAVGGADLLRSLGIQDAPIPFFVAFIVAVAVANLFMGSASAKWAIFAPIFVPMFLQLDYHPAFTQLLYRVGDSITNCVSPLYPYFPLLLGWVGRESPEQARVGSVLALLVPYAFFLLLGWTVMLVLWFLLGLPVGPDSPIRMP